VSLSTDNELQHQFHVSDFFARLDTVNKRWSPENVNTLVCLWKWMKNTWTVVLLHYIITALN